MAIRIWKKPTVLRRYGAQTNSGGYATSATHTDSVVYLDVQVTAESSQVRSDGDHSTMSLKAFGGDEIRTAQDKSRIPADKIYFEGKWYECFSSRKSRNTWIRHWVSEFRECERQDPAPASIESILGGGSV